MSWTYDTALTEPKDQIRFLVQDTDTNEQLVQDEEIAFALTVDSNVYRAAAVIAKSIALYYARQPSIDENDLEEDTHKTAERYWQLALELDGKSGSTSVFAGGISIADVEEREEDADRPEPAFRVAMHT